MAQRIENVEQYLQGVYPPGLKVPYTKLNSMIEALRPGEGLEAEVAVLRKTIKDSIHDKRARKNARERLVAIMRLVNARVDSVLEFRKKGM